MKKTILISSLIVIAVLLAEAYRENLHMDWQHYQRLYKNKLAALARTPQERKQAEGYEIQMRQVVLPELNRVDRCVICHAAVEDDRMKDMPNPLKAHPGNYLEIHEVETVGCTVCHDGQGRAVTEKDAHAVSILFWEKPLLPQPFVASNCLRCHHAASLPELTLINKGRGLFYNNGCLGCHELNGEGGSLAPDLSTMADANIHLKYPKKKEIVERFRHNLNIAYIFESIRQPQIQPEITAMPEFNFTDEEVLALTAFLKGFSQKAVPASYIIWKERQKRRPEQVDGETLYRKYCIACHGADARGGVKNINYVKETVPALNTLAERMFLDNPLDIRYVADLLKKGIDIENMTPPLDVPKRGRVLAQYRAIYNVIEKGSPAGKADPTGPEPLLHMPSWARGLTDEDIHNILAYLLTLSPSALQKTEE